MLVQETKDKKTLMHCPATVWGNQLDFVVDTGAALEGVLSDRVLPQGVVPDAKFAKPVRVGDGRHVWTEGDIEADVDFGPLKMKIKFTVMKTNAFDALLGVRFLRRPEVQGLTFQPPTLQFKTGTVKLEKTRVAREELYSFA